MPAWSGCVARGRVERPRGLVARVEGRVSSGGCRRANWPARSSSADSLETYAVRIPELDSAEILITPCPERGGETSASI